MTSADFSPELRQAIDRTVALVRDARVTDAEARQLVDELCVIARSEGRIAGGMEMARKLGVGAS
jgi:hypothetical protein